MSLFNRILDASIYMCQKYVIGEAEALIGIGERYLRRHPEIDLTTFARKTNGERDRDPVKADHMLESIRRERVRRSYQ